VAKKISTQYDHQKIPIIGLVAENKSSAPATPVNGQIYYDTTALRNFVRENGAWVLASQTGALLTTQLGAASGVASLDGTTHVPIAQIPTGTTGTTVPFGNDARFTDQRVPTDGSVTGGTAGAGVKIAATTITAANIVAGTITDVQVAAANKDGAVGVASLRTLGTGALQAASGTDSRLSDTRVPTDGSVTGGTAGAGVKIAAGTITLANLAASLLSQAAGVESLRQLGFGAANALAGTTRLDQIAVPTAPVSFNSQELTNLGAPTGPNSAARLTDVQASAAGIDNKPSVRAVLTANDGLTGLTARDGVTPVDGDRILAVAQTTASQNGPWIAHSGAWTRPANETVTSGSFWMVTEGTAGAGSQWKVSTPDPIVLGTTALTINQFGAGTTYTGTAGRITVSGGTIDIASTYVGQASITTLGTITTGTWTGTAVAVLNGGTGATTAAGARTNLGAAGVYKADMVALSAGVEVTVTHSLNTTDTIESFKIVSDGTKTDMAVRTIDANSIGVTSDVAYSAAGIRIVVMGG
jgi:hypothetical protein